jgi:hypothetical protein
MSRDLADEILASAGAEHSARHGEVVEFPIRSKFLARTANPPASEPQEADGWVKHLPKVAEYLSAAVLLFTLAWIGITIHRTLALAEVGAVTCSAENSYMWTMPTPDSDVPVLNDAVLKACAKAYRPFG